MQCTASHKYSKLGTFITTLPPCGECLSCRLNDRAIWSSRLVCERKSYPDALFTTLTYRDEDLPTSEAEAKLQFRNFIKRWQKKFGQPRYFAVLEYGTRFGRAHWHVIFFGEDTELSRLRKNGHSIVTDLRIEERWSHGITYTKSCTYSTQGLNITNYVASYLLKGQWSTSESNVLAKQECSLQSRKPYIGKPAQNALCELLTTRHGAKRCATLGTIPERIKMAGRYYRLYPRLRKEICEELQYPYLPVPINNGVVVDLTGNAVLQEKPYATKNQKQALCHELSIATKIRQNRRKNTHADSG